LESGKETESTLEKEKVKVESVRRAYNIFENDKRITSEHVEYIQKKEET